MEKGALSSPAINHCDKVSKVGNLKLLNSPNMDAFRLREQTSDFTWLPGTAELLLQLQSHS